jgi:hypothetical protein
MQNYRDVRHAGILEMNGRTDIEVVESLNPPKMLIWSDYPRRERGQTYVVSYE